LIDTRERSRFPDEKRDLRSGSVLSAHIAFFGPEFPVPTLQGRCPLPGAIRTGFGRRT